MVKMMADIATIGFKAETTGITKANTALDKLAKTADRVDIAITKAQKSLAMTIGSAQQAATTHLQFESSIGQVTKQLIDMSGKLNEAQNTNKDLTGTVNELTKQLKDAQKQIDKNTKSSARYESQIEKLEAKMKELTTTAKKQKQPLEDSGKGAANLGRKAGQAGIQIEQLVNQIKMGQNPMSAFSMQATDLGYVLGFPLLGAVVGITAALAGPFIAALFGGKTSIEELTEAIDDLVSEYGLTEAQFKVMEKQQKDLIATSQETIDKTKEQQAALQARIDVNNLDKVIAKRKELGMEIDDLIERREKDAFAITEYQAVIDTEEKKIQKSKDTIKGYADMIGFVREEREKGNSVNEDWLQSLIKQEEAEKSLTRAFELQFIAMRDGKEATLEMQAADALGLATIEQLPPVIQSWIDKIRELTEAKKEQKKIDDELAALVADEEKEDADAAKQARELDKLIAQVDNYGGAWSRTGNIIVDAFGDANDAVADHLKQLKTLNKLEADLRTERAKYSDDSKEAIKIEEAIKEVQADQFQASIAGYANMAGAMGSFFGEQTAARKAFHAVESALSGAELAMNIQRTAVELGLIQTRTTAKVAEGASSMFAALGPFAWPAIGAMVATMAAFGFTGGGGGGSAKTGTGSAGTAMGGGVSESLDEANQDLERIMVDQLAELRGLRSDMSKVQDLSFGLFRDLIAVDPGHSEIRNRTEKMLENSFKAMDGATGLDAPFTGELQAIFSAIGEGIKEAMSILSLSTDKSLSDFVYDIGKISFDKLDPEAANDRLNQILSAQSDKMVEMMVPFVTEYQQLGEGAFETLVRLAQEQAIFNDALDMMGNSLGELSSVMQIEVTQNIIDLAGGIDAVTDAMDEFFSEFMSETEQFDWISKSLTEALGTVGLSLFDNRDALKDYMVALDLSTEAGQQQYAMLLELIPTLDDYYDRLEEAEEDRLALLEDRAAMEIELLYAQGKTTEALALERAAVLAALDESLRDLQQEIWDTEDAASALAKAEAELEQARLDAIEELESQISELESGLTVALAGLEKSINAEKDLAKARLEGVEAARDAEIERVNGLLADLEANKTQLESNLSDSRSALESAFSAEMNAIQSAASARIEALNEEKSAIQSALSVVDSLANSIASRFNSVSTVDALAAARRGDFSLAQQLDVSGQLDSSQFSSASGLAIAQAVDNYRLGEIGRLAENEASSLERQLSAIDRQTEAVQAAADAQVEELQAQLSALLGIDDTVLSVDEAIKQYQEAQKALDELNYEGEKERLESLIDIANDAYEMELDFYEAEIARLDSILDNSTEQVNALLGIDDTILSVDDSLARLSDAIAAANGAELEELRKELVRLQESTANNTADAARTLRQIQGDVLDVRVIE